jgi:hypothetical protein
MSTENLTTAEKWVGVLDNVQQRLLEVVTQVVLNDTRCEIRKRFKANSCVATTRVVVNVFQHFGFEAVPLHVEATVWNPAWVDAIRHGEEPPYQLGQDELHRWMDERGAWSVSTEGASKDEPVRHLVAYVPALPGLIDASINQCNRPERNIDLPDSVGFIITPEELSVGGMWQVDVNDCWIEYSRVLDNREAWRSSSDWVGNTGTAAVQSELIRLVERAIGHKAVAG